MQSAVHRLNRVSNQKRFMTSFAALMRLISRAVPWCNTRARSVPLTASRASSASVAWPASRVKVFVVHGEYRSGALTYRSVMVAERRSTPASGAAAIS
jgi:hypothetical protein